MSLLWCLLQQLSSLYSPLCLGQPTIALLEADLLTYGSGTERWSEATQRGRVKSTRARIKDVEFAGRYTFLRVVCCVTFNDVPTTHHHTSAWRAERGPARRGAAEVRLYWRRSRRWTEAHSHSRTPFIERVLVVLFTAYSSHRAPTSLNDWLTKSSLLTGKKYAESNSR